MGRRKKKKTIVAAVALFHLPPLLYLFLSLFLPLGTSSAAVLILQTYFPSSSISCTSSYGMEEAISYCLSSTFLSFTACLLLFLLVLLLVALSVMMETVLQLLRRRQDFEQSSERDESHFILLQDNKKDSR